MKIRSLFTVILVGVVLTSCTQRTTDYCNPVAPEVSTTWRVVDVRVNVPDTLTVSEANTYAPDADIVWHGDNLVMGVTRQQQVAAILKAGITDAGARLHGGKPVILQATLLQFHALSPKARDSVGGIHNVDFMLSVIDAATGTLMMEPVRIEADEFALSGLEATEAVARGDTQKRRIRNRIRLVVGSWLGVAPANERVVPGSVFGIGR